MGVSRNTLQLATTMPVNAIRASIIVRNSNLNSPSRLPASKTPEKGINTSLRAGHWQCVNPLVQNQLPSLSINLFPARQGRKKILHEQKLWRPQLDDKNDKIGALRTILTEQPMAMAFQKLGMTESKIILYFFSSARVAYISTFLIALRSFSLLLQPELQ